VLLARAPGPPAPGTRQVPRC